MAGFTLIATACGGEGAGCLAPADFPVDQRIPNAVQVRLAQPGFQRIGDQVEDMIVAALGSTRLGFEPQCEGNVKVCCGLPADTCGITFDLSRPAGAPPRLAFTELADGREGLAMSFSTRIHTERTLDVDIRVPLLGTSNCEIDIDTALSGVREITIGAALTALEDPLTQATRIGLSDFTLDGLEAEDIDSRGGGQCGSIEDRLDDIRDGLLSSLSESAPKLIEVPFCKSCQSDVDCATGSSCNEEFVCEVPGATEDDAPRCIQQLGTVGRLPAGGLFGELAAGSALDLYMVSNSTSAPAGGLSFSANSGMVIPQLEGVAPGTAGCAPVLPAPEIPDGIGLSEMMSANSIDDLGEFDFGIAIHRAFLDRAGWALHQSGMFCTTIDTSSNEALDADSLAVFFPSLGDLVEGAKTPVAVRLRPQKPPTFKMGGPGGALTVEFADFDVDFFMNFRERNVRLFSARSDVAIPLDLGTNDEGGIVPIVGDLSGAFTNIRVTNPGLIGEESDQVAAKFEAIGGLAVSTLIGAIGDFQLPGLPFLSPELMEKGFRGLDDGEFLGVFGNFRIGPPPDMMPFAPSERSVKTTAELAAVHLPDASAYSAARLDPALTPSIEIELGGSGPLSTNLEWQYRISGGAWSPYTRERRLTISRIEMWVPQTHEIEVRARHWDRPESTDPTPAKFVVDLRPQAEALAGVAIGGEGAALDPNSDNGCASSSSGRGALWLVLAVLFSLAVFRRRQAATLCCMLLLGAAQTGCMIGGGSEAEKGPAYGRWSDVASDGVRAVASSYESRKGDLVLGTVVASGVKAFEIVDEEGDVGAWSSVVLDGGYARIAYQDRSNGRLKFATESIEGFDNHVIDESGGVTIGRYASLSKRPSGGYGIVYIAENPQEEGGAITQLRIAETTSAKPNAGSDWTVKALDFARVQTIETNPADSVPLGTGLYSKLVYTAAGDPVVAYCDTTAPALVVARRSAGAWTSSVLDDNAETGPCAFASMAIAGDDAVHIAYQTTIAADLRYLRLAPGAISGSVVVVDDGARDNMQHPVGGSATITLTPAGLPLIVYQDGYTLEMRIASESGGAWSHEVAATGAMALGFSAGMAWFRDQLIISCGAVDRSRLQAHQITSVVRK